MGMGNGELVMVANYKLLKISCKLIANSQFPIPDSQINN